MTKITQIDDRSAATAWSPVREHADVIALGKKDSGGAGFDETGGELELYDLNLSQGSSNDGQQHPMLLGSVKTQSRFASLGWSVGASPTVHPMGLIAGGMENGTVHVWDPHAVITGSGTPLVASYSQHVSGSIKALQFNPHNPLQLATGGANGQVLLHDLSNPDAPPVAPCADTQQSAQITSVAWNSQVSHIIASAAADGTVAVWDWKNKKQWCELREATGQAISDIAWNPTQGLHLLTASGDDRNPVIKLWDLRASTSMPLASLPGHQKGIYSIAWCPHDDHLLMSCGKDNQSLLWDLYTLKPIAALPNDPIVASQEPLSASQRDVFSGGLEANSHRRYDVQWSPIKRGVISTASLDRKVQAHSILGLSTQSGRPPKWMRPASSVSFGFAGSLVSCGASDKVVRLRTFVEDKDLAALSNEFETALQASTLVDYCKNRALQAVADPEEVQLWSFMQVIFETNARQELLNTLGFEPTVVADKAASYEEDSKAEDNGHTATRSSMSRATEEMVKETILVGNFEAAVDCCFRTGNLADALILASCGGPDLWARTQERYFEMQSPKLSILSTVGGIIRDELGPLVEKSDPKKWTETLAILSTYGKAEEFPALCVRLGDLLEAAGDNRNASLCYMCSLNLDKTVSYWRSQLEAANEKNGCLSYAALHEFVVKVSVFLQAAGPSAQLPEEDAELFSKYASKIAEQGLFVAAAKYTKGTSVSSQVLKDRLYRSKSSPNCLAAMGNVAPEFPFSVTDSRQERRRAALAAAKVVPTEQKDQQTLNLQNGHTHQQQHHPQASYSNGTTTPATIMQPGALPLGWVELVDPGSGQTYYANQTTGETTWERPQAAMTAVTQPSPSGSYSNMQSLQSDQQTMSTQNTLASKYGDGFVTSASHPGLASQYGNVGTSNPYAGTQRPGTAQVGVVAEKAPVSATLDLQQIETELREEYMPIKDCLPSLLNALKDSQLTAVEKKLLSEAEKGVAVFLKRLVRQGMIPDQIGTTILQMCGYINSYDFRSAQSLVTGLVNTDWKEHKDWLKGMKSLLQLASKKFSH